MLDDAGEPPPLSLDELLELLRSEDAGDRIDALAELSSMLDTAYDDEAALIGEALRGVAAVPLLGWLAADASSPEVQQLALLVLGNLCSDATDPNSALTKRELFQAGGGAAIVQAVRGEDPAVLLYACGCVQNLCNDLEWSQALASLGVSQRLEQLLAHDDEKVVHYAAGGARARRPIHSSRTEYEYSQAWLAPNTDGGARPDLPSVPALSFSLACGQRCAT